MDPGKTVELLNRWHAGDREALAHLLQRDLPWIRAHVSRRLGPLLRQKGETVDYVQDAFVAALQYGPRFVVADTVGFPDGTGAGAGAETGAGDPVRYPVIPDARPYPGNARLNEEDNGAAESARLGRAGDAAAHRDGG